MQPIDACSAIRPREKASQAAVFDRNLLVRVCALWHIPACTAFEIETDISESVIGRRYAALFLAPTSAVRLALMPDEPNINKTRK